MSHKFKLLLLFCLISFQLDAQLEIVETIFAIHCYVDLAEEPLLIIPKDASSFISLVHQDIQIEGQLGSYHLEKATLHKAKKLSFESYQFEENELLIVFNYKYRKKDFSLVLNIIQIEQENKTGLALKLQGSLPQEINGISFTLADNSPAIFGGGIQFSHLNLRGQSFPLIVEENGVGRGDKGSTFFASLFGAAGNEHSTYAPMPRFYSSNGKSYELMSQEANALWEVDFNSANSISFYANHLEEGWNATPIIHISQQSPLEFAQLGGNPKSREAYLLQDWMQGYILGVQGGKEKVDSLINVLRENNIELKAIWIQDWVGKRQTVIGSRLQWDWRPNYSVYPNLESWIDSLHQMDIKVLGYINPYFVEGGEQTIEGIHKEVFVKQSNGEAYKFKAGGFEAYMIDLSNQEALVWIKDIIKINLLSSGFDGWMCDFGEWLPFNDIKLSNTCGSTLNHNLFPQQWLSVNQEAIKEFCEAHDKSGTDFLVFNRSWYSENGEMPGVMWLGDQMANFGENDGLQSAITAYNSAAISGIPVTHSDIGGYTAIKIGPIKFVRNDETLKRWIEMEAFTPLWRSHEGLMPDHMSQIYQDEKMMSFFAQFDSIHQSLIGTHFKAAQQELVEKGYPLVRSLFMMYPNDPNTYELKTQFFVGSDLLICPVLQANSSSVEVYLPGGTWKHFFTNQLYKGGGNYAITAPLGQPAVFERLE